MVAEVSIRNVIWHQKAQQEFDSTLQWCRFRFGERIATKFYRQTKSREKMLSIFPYMGPIEESLSDLPIPYRYLLVHQHFKLIYYVDESQSELHIVDFWDVRRDPKQLTIDNG